jgi:hypothetical protein
MLGTNFRLVNDKIYGLGPSKFHMCSPCTIRRKITSFFAESD